MSTNFLSLLSVLALAAIIFSTDLVLIGDLAEVFSGGLVVSQSGFVFGFKVAQIDGLAVHFDSRAPTAARLGKRNSPVSRACLTAFFWQQSLSFLQSANDQIALPVIQTVIEPAGIDLFSFWRLHQKAAQGDL